jgi:hypothetical protein
VVMNQYLANNVWLKVPANGVYFVHLIRTTHTASFSHIFLGFLVRHLAITEFLPDFCLWLSVCFSDLLVSGPQGLVVAKSGDLRWANVTLESWPMPNVDRPTGDGGFVRKNVENYSKTSFHLFYHHFPIKGQFWSMKWYEPFSDRP